MRGVASPAEDTSREGKKEYIVDTLSRRIGSKREGENSFCKKELKLDPEAYTGVGRGKR